MYAKVVAYIVVPLDHQAYIFGILEGQGWSSKRQLALEGTQECPLLQLRLCVMSKNEQHCVWAVPCCALQESSHG